MKLFNRTCDQTQLQPNGTSPSSCLRLIASENETEIEEVRMELLKAGIASEKRRQLLAEAFGVGAVELWVQNERDFFNASVLYARMQQPAANRPPATSQNPEPSVGPGDAPKLNAEPSSTSVS